jgi:hypothetical protein
MATQPQDGLCELSVDVGQQVCVTAEYSGDTRVKTGM